MKSTVHCERRWFSNECCKKYFVIQHNKSVIFFNLLKYCSIKEKSTLLGVTSAQNMLPNLMALMVIYGLTK